MLQTLRNPYEGINLFCIEPATPDRLPRKELHETGAATPHNGSQMSNLEMLFDSGKLCPEGVARWDGNISGRYDERMLFGSQSKQGK